MSWVGFCPTEPPLTCPCSSHPAAFLGLQEPPSSPPPSLFRCLSSFCFSSHCWGDHGVPYGSCWMLDFSHNDLGPCGSGRRLTSLDLAQAYFSPRLNGLSCATYVVPKLSRSRLRTRPTSWSMFLSRPHGPQQGSLALWSCF